MEYQKLKREIQTVGAWYLATFISDIIIHYWDLQDLSYKKNFIHKLQESATGGEISLESTTTKVNGILRIIKAGKSREALKIIIAEVNPKKVPQGTIACAVGILACIEDEKISLPI